MRFTHILPVAAFASVVLASPLQQIVHHQLSTAASSEGTDGAVAITLARIDDLVDDKSGNALLLERVSHITLSIAIRENTLRVNDEAIPLDGTPAVVNGEDQAIVKVVKADALLLPGGAPASTLSADEVAALASKLSPGFVSLEVRIESQTVDQPAGAVAAVNDGDHDDVMRVQPIGGVRLRKLGVFIKLHEVEVQGVTQLEHSSLLYIPVLQLLVSSGPDAPTRVHTLAISGQAPGSVAAGAGGPADVEAEHSPVPHSVEHEAAPRMERPTMFGWLAGLFGLTNEHRGPARFGGMRSGSPRPCSRLRRPTAVTGNQASIDALTQAANRADAATDGVVIENPWLQGTERDEAAAGAVGTVGERMAHRHRHHSFGHHHRGRGFHLGCALRRMARGVAYVSASIWSFLVTKILLGCAVGWAIGAARQRRIELAVEDAADVVEEEEKVKYHDDLPAYAHDGAVVVEVDGDLKA